jgi:hypothetical protein
LRAEGEARGREEREQVRTRGLGSHGVWGFEGAHGVRKRGVWEEAALRVEDEERAG